MQICHTGDCFLTGGLRALLFAAWLFWYWHSTTWACSAAPWDTTSTPHRQREAASQTQEERCLSRESSAWIQAVKIWPLCCSFNNIVPPRLHICIHTEFKLESVRVWPKLSFGLIVCLFPTVGLGSASSSPGC